VEQVHDLAARCQAIPVPKPEFTVPLRPGFREKCRRGLELETIPVTRNMAKCYHQTPGGKQQKPPIDRAKPAERGG